jgi:hypothetical protein
VYGDAKMQKTNGTFVNASFWHVKRLCDVIEKDARSVGHSEWLNFSTPAQSPINLAGLVSTKSFAAPDIAELKASASYYKWDSNRAWEAEMATVLGTGKPHPLDGFCCIKSLGDKGGGSFKEGLMLMNQEDCNSPRNFSMTMEFHNVPDNHANLSLAFEQHAAEYAALSNSSLVLITSSAAGLVAADSSAASICVR